MVPRQVKAGLQGIFNKAQPAVGSSGRRFDEAVILRVGIVFPFSVESILLM